MSSYVSSPNSVPRIDASDLRVIIQFYHPIMPKRSMQSKYPPKSTRNGSTTFP
jgi:hypothetical protein